MDSKKRVLFPDEMLEQMDIEKTIFAKEMHEHGIAVLSEKEGSGLILRIYQLMRGTEGAYSPVQELAAFNFKNRGDLDDFLTKLPNITGLEMLLLLNPLQNETTVH